MTRRFVLPILASAGLFALLLAGARAGAGLGAGPGSAIADRREVQEGRAAPEFPSLDAASWAGTPTSLASLRGRVVLLNVWTFG